jgi:hypothetical protein
MAGGQACAKNAQANTTVARDGFVARGALIRVESTLSVGSLLVAGLKSMTDKVGVGGVRKKFRVEMVVKGQKISALAIAADAVVKVAHISLQKR